ncbi:MAG: CBS domain-containing protein [Nitrospirales bacterium]|nr:CBS domain-containing protein [Nitrospirales bacterium]MDR4482771.1 CBS domain-containing protein [Nitrospirales bacterium]
MGPQKTSKTDRVGTLDQDIARIRQQLEILKKFLIDEPSTVALNEFDSATEDILADALGSSSPLLDTYDYAQLGEVAGLMNLSEEAPEGTTHHSQRETIRQRQRVLESGIADLEARRASLSQETKKRKSSGPTVSDYMAKAVRSVSLDATLQEVGQCLQKWKIGSVLVQSGDEYLGYITETELTREVVASGTNPVTTTVKTCMREPLVTVETSDPIVEAVRLMKEKGTRHLAVTESNRIVGVISVSDIIRYYSGVM